VTFGLGNRCSIQLSYGTGRFRLTRPRMGRERRRALSCVMLAAQLAASLPHPLAASSARPPPGCMGDPTTATIAVAEITGAASFRLADGREVWLASILPPGPLDGAESEAAASRVALTALARGKMMAMQAEPKPDRYGRVVVRAAIVDGVWIEAALVAAGRARVLPADHSCVAALIGLEAAARTAQAGLWAHPAFRPFDASDLSALNAAIGRYAVVEGVIRRTGGTRGRLYLDFGRRFREDFSIIVSREIAAVLAKSGAQPRNWRGRRVRVRGMLLAWGGPAIELSSAAAIELLDKSEP
jgi:micrococcal nuclease